MTYLLDANIFIEPYQRLFPPVICPGFWDWLKQGFESGKLVSIREVRDEVKDPWLAEWIKEIPQKCFEGPDQERITSQRVVSDWVKSCGDYDDGGISLFLDAPDYKLVSHAHAHDLTVVTLEKSNNKRSEVKIPEVCDALKIKIIHPFKMMEVESVRLILG